MGRQAASRSARMAALAHGLERTAAVSPLVLSADGAEDRRNTHARLADTPELRQRRHLRRCDALLGERAAPVVPGRTARVPREVLQRVAAVPSRIPAAN